jgi:DNA-binding CsgD family transcriptional regulator
VFDTNDSFTSPKASRSPRVEGDPDKYIRLVKGGKYQARPYVDGVRENLGLFPTKHAARVALQEYWWGRLKARPRFARPMPGNGGLFFALVVLPAVEPYPRQSVRVGGTYPTAADAHQAAVGWLERRLGKRVAESIVVERGGIHGRLGRPEFMLSPEYLELRKAVLARELARGARRQRARELRREGRTVAEIAAALGCGEGAVRRDLGAVTPTDREERDRVRRERARQQQRERDRHRERRRRERQRQQAVEDRREKVRELLALGLTLERIAEVVRVSESTVLRDVRHLRATRAPAGPELAAA